ncbi:MAG: elongation factor-1 alpha, partial [Ghiorsea sp.]|nr:elongation factor-1 alpha [Ghiorsea sp.]
IHLFGISFIFFFVGAIFVLAKSVPVWLKGTVIALPFVSQIMDIASWWLTKFDPMFAWLVLVGGSGMGAAFAFMWFVSIYEMWISKRDDASVIDEH